MRQWHAVLGVWRLQIRNMGSGWRHGVRVLRLGLNLTFLWPRDDDNRNPTRMMRDEPSLSFLTLMAMVVCHNCYSCTMQVAVSALLSLFCRSGQALVLGASMACCAWSLLFAKSQYGQWLETWCATFGVLVAAVGLKPDFPLATVMMTTEIQLG